MRYRAHFEMYNLFLMVTPICYGVKMLSCFVHVYGKYFYKFDYQFMIKPVISN